MINGGDNSHDLPSAKGRPMKAGSIIQPEFKGLRTRGANGVNSSLGQEKMICPSLRSETGKKKRKEINSSFSYLLPFAPLRPSVDWMMPHHTRESHLLYRVHKVKRNHAYLESFS